MIDRYGWRALSRELLLVLGAAAFCLPLYFLITVSLKPSSEAYLDPLSLPASPDWISYKIVFTGDGSSVDGLGSALLGSTIITIGSVCLLLAFGTFAAFIIARRNNRTGAAMYLVFVVGLILPFELGLVPLYAAMRNLGLVGSYGGMIILYTGMFLPLTIFLYTGFIRTLPRDYEEAAQVDGASPARVFCRIVLPLLLPVTGTVAVLTGMFIWNHFFTQLVFLAGTDKTTAPVALYSLANANVQRWNEIFAAAAIIMAPIFVFFLFAQKTMIRGYSGGVKG